jgi:hypothetical protein
VNRFHESHLHVELPPNTTLWRVARDTKLNHELRDWVPDQAARCASTFASTMCNLP